MTFARESEENVIPCPAAAAMKRIIYGKPLHNADEIVISQIEVVSMLYLVPSVK